MIGLDWEYILTLLWGSDYNNRKFADLLKVVRNMNVDYVYILFINNL